MLFFYAPFPMKDRILSPIIAGLSFIMIFTRRPDAILLPQFWAEDGRVWYADAYNLGAIAPFLTPEAGYFQTFSRLVALFSQSFSLSSAPLAFNLSAITLQSLVAAFIVSCRFSGFISDQRWRIAAAFLYVALPHSWEVNANVTNSQWHLGLLSFLIVVSAPGESRFSRFTDFLVLGVATLSGPLCLLILPIGVLRYINGREKHTLILVLILCAGSMIQSSALLSHERPPQAELGATVQAFFAITGRHLFAAPVMGGKTFSAVLAKPGLEVVALALANAIGFVFFVFVLLKATLELRLFLLFCVLIFIAALASPAVSSADPQWRVMADYDTALRYWFIPSFFAYISLIYFAANGRTWLRYAAAGALSLSVVGIVTDWKNPRMTDLDFQAHAEEFGRTAPGTVFEIPINPPPDWKMTLIKKP